MTTILEDLQPTQLIVLREAIRFGHTIRLCLNPACTRINSHFGDCSNQRGRHRPTKSRGPVTPSDAPPQLPAPLARRNTTPPTDWLNQ